MVTYSFKDTFFQRSKGRFFIFIQPPKPLITRGLLCRTESHFLKFDVEFTPSLPFLFLSYENLGWNFVKTNESIIVIEGVYNDFRLTKHLQLLGINLQSSEANSFVIIQKFSKSTFTTSWFLINHWLCLEREGWTETWRVLNGVMGGQGTLFRGFFIGEVVQEELTISTKEGLFTGNRGEDWGIIIKPTGVVDLIYKFNQHVTERPPTL